MSRDNACSGSHGFLLGPFVVAAGVAPAAPGEIEFTPIAHYPTVTPPTSIAAGDINGDATPDVALTREWGGLEFFVGLGDGSFDWPIRTVLTSQTPGLGRLIDLNRDHLMDFLWVDAAGRYDDLYTITNDQAGRRGRVDLTEIPGRALAMRVRDLDGDGDTDAVYTARYASSRLCTLANRQDFLEVHEEHPLAYRSAYDLETGDFDADGDLDAATLCVEDYDSYYYSYTKVSASAVVVFLNDGSGRLHESATVELPWRDDTHIVPRLLTSGDWDGDGDLDLIVAAEDTDDWLGSGTEWLTMTNAGDGLSFETGDVRRLADRGPTSLIAADVNVDGRLDFAMTVGSGEFIVHEGRGDFGFADPVTISIGRFGANHTEPTDVDGDGKIDLVVADADGFTVMSNATAIDAPSLTVGRLVRGQPVELVVEGLEPNDQVEFLYSRQGWRPTAGQPDYGGIVLDLAEPIHPAGTARADQSGVARLELNVPPGIARQSVIFQAVAVRGPDGLHSVKTPFALRVVETH